MKTSSTEEPASKEMNRFSMKNFPVVDIAKKKFSPSPINTDQCVTDKALKDGPPGDGANVSNRPPLPNNEAQPEGSDGLFSMLASRSAIAVGKLGDVLTFNRGSDDKNKEPKTDNSASNGMQSTQDHRNESRSNPGLKTKEFDGNECVKGVATNNEEGSVGARFGQLFNSVVSVFRGSEMEQKSEGEAVHEHAIAHTSDQKDKEESRLETLEKEEEFAALTSRNTAESGTADEKGKQKQRRSSLLAARVAYKGAKTMHGLKRYKHKDDDEAPFDLKCDLL